jgi:hypothetical protein
MEILMSYKPVFVMDDGERASNAQRFKTEEEALLAAFARFRVWTMPVDYGVDESSDPVNYRWDENLGAAVCLETA